MKKLLLMSVLVASLTTLGCVGAASPGVLGAVVLSLGVWLSGLGACRWIDWEGPGRNCYTICDGGQITEVESCCPRGAPCNYLSTPWSDCGDGTCVEEPDRCDENECDGTLIPYTKCSDGMPMETTACCPQGMECNFGRDVEVCEDGTCVDGGAECPTPPPPPPAETCDGYLEFGCDNSQLTALCCPDGMFCNFGRDVEVCEDGSCVDGGAECPTPPPPPPAETCDGSWELGCDNSQLAAWCCPANMACNFGMGMELCGDGSCGHSFIPEQTCAEPWDCSGRADYACIDHTIQAVCCPAGIHCDYDGIEYCGGTSCVTSGDTCPTPN